MEQVIIGIIFVILGGIMVIRPSLYLNFQIWVQKKIMGADYNPTSRTEKIIKFMGGVFIILGLVNVIGYF